MAILLFSLRDVPDDENFEIKELLDTHEINYYETSAGNWGVSMPALWLRDKDQLEKAQKLLSEYHTQRALSQKKYIRNLKVKNKTNGYLMHLSKTPLNLLSTLPLLPLSSIFTQKCFWNLAYK